DVQQSNSLKGATDSEHEDATEGCDDFVAGKNESINLLGTHLENNPEIQQTRVQDDYHVAPSIIGAHTFNQYGIPSTGNPTDVVMVIIEHILVTSVMRRWKLSNKSNGECSYYMWRQRFPVKVENRVEGREEVDNWVITLAFLREERVTTTRNKVSAGIYAFFPTEMVTGLPFIIQEDFLLVSSRESIRWDDNWNKGILDCIPSAFCLAFLYLVKSVEFDPPSSRSYYFDKYLPIYPPSYAQLFQGCAGDCYTEWKILIIIAIGGLFGLNNNVVRTNMIDCLGIVCKKFQSILDSLIDGGGALCRWSAIAGHLLWRTNNEIKNYRNTHLKKRLLQMGIDPVTHRPRMDLFDFSSMSPFLGPASLTHMTARWENASLQEAMTREYMRMYAAMIQQHSAGGGRMGADLMRSHLENSLSRPDVNALNNSIMSLIWAQNLENQMLSLLPPLEGKSVVELGSGIGHYTVELAKMVGHVLVMDFIESIINKNEETNGHLKNVQFMCVDVTSLDLKIEPGSVDIIFSN
ncbi:hypothetical protein KI387_014880, partial [Taxus chinensis]